MADELTTTSTRRPGMSWEEPYMQSRQRQDTVDAASAFPPPPPAGADSAANVGDPSKRNATNAPGSAQQDGGGVPPSPETQGLADGAASVLRDMGGEMLNFLTDIPLQTLGAMRDLGEEVNQMTAAGGQAIADFLDVPNPDIEELLPMGGFRLTGDGPFYIPPDEFRAMQGGGRFERMVTGEAPPPLFPEVAPGKSKVLSPFYRNAMRLVFGFKVVKGATAFKSLEATGKGAKLAVEMGRGAMTDILVWGAHEERLADFVQKFPFMQNPIAEYLASDEDDGVFEGKLKQAIEGAIATGTIKLAAKGVTELVGLIGRGVKMIKHGRKVVEALPEEAVDEIAAAAERQSRDFLILGDPTGKLTTATTVDALQPARHAMGALDEGMAAKAATGTQARAKGLAAAAEQGSKVKSMNEVNEIAQSMGFEKGQGSAAYTGSHYQEYTLWNGKKYVHVKARIADHPEPPGRINQGFGANISIYPGNDFTIDQVKDVFERASKRIGIVPKAAAQKLTVPNFAAFKGPDDWTTVLREMAEANADIAARGKGGVKSQISQVQAAKDIGLPELFSVEAGRMKPAELYALKDAYGQSAVKLHEMAKLAANAPNPTNLFNFRKMMAIHQSLLERFMSERAEAGRALNILGRTTELSGGSERLLAMKDLLEEMGGEDVAQALANKIAGLSDATPEALNEVVKRGWAAKTMDAVQEAWVLGLVSGPRSQARNIISNAAYAVQLVTERAWAARMPGSAVEKGEALAAAHGMVTSLREAFVNSGKAFWNGVGGYGIGKVDLPYRKSISGEALGLHGAPAYVADGIGELYRVWGRLLTAGDEFFKTINYNGEKSALAVRRAIGEGLTDDAMLSRAAELAANPDEAMRIAARDAAQYATFTQKLGKAGQYWQGLVGELPMLRFLTPFIRTPGNIFKAGLSRSPLALAMPKTFWAEVAKGGAARDMAIAKFTMGSSLMALWSDLTLRGVINGSGPTDRNEFRAWYDAGNRPYTINLPKSPALGSLSGKQIDYRTIEPIGTMLAMSADVTHRLMEYNEIADSGDPDAQERMWKLASASVFAVAENLTNTTFMRSASEFFTVMNDPAMYAERWLERYVQTAVPRIVATWKQGQDPTLREVHGAWEAIESQIPWVSEGLYPVRNFDGYPRQHGTTWGPDWLSPLYVGDTTKAAPHLQEIIRQKIRLNNPRRVQSFTDPDTGISVRINLDQFPDVFDEFRQLEGHKLKHPGFEDMGRDAYLSNLVTGAADLSDVYDTFIDGHEEGVEDKGNFVASIVNKYRAAARDAIMRDPEYDDQFYDFRQEISRRARIMERRRMEAVQ